MNREELIALADRIDGMKRSWLPMAGHVVQITFDLAQADATSAALRAQADSASTTEAKPMTESERKLTFDGEDIETMHRDVLVELIRRLYKQLEAMRRTPAQPASGGVEGLRQLAFGLMPSDQYRLAFFIAENLGYILMKDPSCIDEDAAPVSEAGREALKDMLLLFDENGDFIAHRQQTEAALRKGNAALYASPPHPANQVDQIAFVCPCCGTRGTTDGKASSILASDHGK